MKQITMDWETYQTEIGEGRVILKRYEKLVEAVWELAAIESYPDPSAYEGYSTRIKTKLSKEEIVKLLGKTLNEIGEMK